MGTEVVSGSCVVVDVVVINSVVVDPSPLHPSFSGLSLIFFLFSLSLPFQSLNQNKAEDGPDPVS